MAALIGLVIGGVLGHALWGDWGTIAGGLIGFFAGVAVASNRARAAYRKPDTAAASSIVAPPPPDAALASRVAQLEARIAQLEGALSGAGIVVPATAALRDRIFAPSADTIPPFATPSIGARPSPAEVPTAAMTAAEATATPSLDTLTPTAATTAAEASSALDTAAAASAPAATISAPPPAEPRSPNRLWAWFTGGNALTRIGVVVLFFGIAFLLRYFAEHFTVPLELRLLGVAAGGLVLIALGIATVRARPGYGLSLQGAGAGVLYLTAFATYRLYALVPDEVAAPLLVAIAVLTVYLAIRYESQALAALAIAGGFLAPLLTLTQGAPLPLFGYVAILNAAVFALAWLRDWRTLNALGFVFTLALGLFWGWRYYTPEYFATVEPFLALFFVFYVAIAILEARRGAFEAVHPVDGLLVFGVPLAGFVLQAELVADIRYGAAWSALALAVVYALLYALLRRQALPALRLLAHAFLALAVIFATLALPLAFDTEWTAALWAIEAAGVYWLGVRQGSRAARSFALLVEVGAGIAFFAAGGASPHEPMFANGHFIGAMAIALAGFATAFFGDRGEPALPASERPLTPLVFGWAAIWWLAGGGAELVVHLARAEEVHAALAWVVASVALALVLSRLLRWPRLAALGVALLPVMAIAAIGDFERARTTLTVYGFVLWPAAWIAHALVLRAADETRGEETSTARGRATLLAVVHAVSAVALVAQISWEASEWVGRATPGHTAWVACAAALPAIVYLALTPMFAASTRWPFVRYAEAYAVRAARVLAAFVVVWFFAVNVLSPGDVTPLPYIPLANPLDLTLALALGAAFVWARRVLALPSRTLYAWLGVALFVALNGVVLRSVHHWLGIPWRIAPLLSSKPLQAALTLTWTVTALAVMALATRRGLRPLWMVGAALLAVVVAKLFLVDLSALSGLPRVVSFVGVGLLLLAIGYVSPLPPAARDDEPEAVP